MFIVITFRCNLFIANKQSVRLDFGILRSIQYFQIIWLYYFIYYDTIRKIVRYAFEFLPAFINVLVQLVEQLFLPMKIEFSFNMIVDFFFLLFVIIVLTIAFKTNICLTLFDYHMFTLYHYECCRCIMYFI